MCDIIAAVNSELGDYRIEISTGEAYDPREEEFRSPGDEMVCWHRRYNLGDETHIGWNSKEKHDYAKEKELKFKNEDIGIAVPLYLYDHSGMTMSTKPFGCKFDSGQVGIYFMTKEFIISVWNDYTDKTKDVASLYINNQVKMYDLYIRGEAYDCCCFYKNEEVECIRDELSEFDYFIEDILPDSVPERYKHLVSKLKYGVVEPRIEIPVEDIMATYAH